MSSLKPLLAKVFAGATLGICLGTGSSAMYKKLVQPETTLPHTPVTYYFDRPGSGQAQQSAPHTLVQHNLITEIKRAVLLAEGPKRMLKEFDKWGGLYNKNAGTPAHIDAKLKEYRRLFGPDIEGTVRAMLPPYMADQKLTGTEFVLIAVELGRISDAQTDPALLPYAQQILAKHGIEDADGSKAQNLLKAASFSVSEARRTGSPEPAPAKRATARPPAASSFLPG